MAGESYKKAGVDIEAGEKAVRLIKKFTHATYSKHVLCDIGSFAGLFQPALKGFKEPVLVSGTDGVGTKLEIAQQLGVYDTVGIDLVAMCVNDIITSGAEPLFFLDYIACGKLIPEDIAEIVKGIAAGCREAGCSLIGGETAEMPGFYRKGRFDLAGFAVGIVEKSDIIGGAEIKPGDAVVAFPSSGIHSNGYSLVRKIVKRSGFKYTDRPAGFKSSLGLSLLEPTRIYAKTVLGLKKIVRLKGLAHITGGGISGNLNRILPKGTDALVDLNTWKPPAVFNWLAETGNVATSEMLKTFNMGAGLMAVVSQKDAALIASEKAFKGAWIAGEIVRGNGEVAYAGK